MNVKIKETGKVEELVIVGENGIEWTSDLVGNAGAFGDGQFVWSEDDDAYVADQDTFDWWQRYITDSYATDDEVAALAKDLGIDEEGVRFRIGQAQDGDYERHRDIAIMVMEEIREECAN